jgi:DnaJ-class molecular chaperone
MGDNWTACSHCHGSGIKFDITCSDNVNTYQSANTTCRVCDGTGVDTTPAGRTFDEIWRDSKSAGEIPEWML